MKIKLTKKKIIIIVIIAVLVLTAIIVPVIIAKNKEVKNSSVTNKLVTAVVATRTIENTLSSSGEITTATEEELDLSTSKYFSTMCVEEDDTVEEGENILKYTDGTYLTAPYDLVIESYSVPDTGDKCTSSNYVKVESLEELKMTLSINESEINSVSKGQEVTITLSSDESKTYEGEITKIDAIGSYATSGTTYTAEVEFENDGNVKLGMSASCEIILEKVENAIAVPIEAIQTKDDEKYVIIENEDGSTEEVTVTTGISDDSYVEILTGLEGGETIEMVSTTTSTTAQDRAMNSSSNSSSSFGGGSFGGGMPGGDMPSGGPSN